MTAFDTAQDAVPGQIKTAVVEDMFTCPASFAQERLWFLDQFEPDSAVYNLRAVFRMEGNLDFAALQRTFDQIIARHESLRTVFGTADGRPIQIIAPQLQVPIRREDLRHIPLADHDAEILKIADAETLEPFDLSKGPLVRLSLLTLGEQSYVFLLTLHHIIADGWSAGVLSGEMNAYYTAEVTHQPARMPELSIQYADYATWQKEWLQGEALHEELDFWKDHLAGAPAFINLPTDHPRPATMSFEGTSHKFDFTPELSEAMELASRQLQVTPFMLLLATYEVFLSRYTGQQDFVIGTPIAGRTRVELEPIIGLFTNTLVLRAKTGGNLTFKELVHNVRNVALNAYSHQELPFEKLVEELQPERNLSYNPLFQVMFVLQNAPEEEFDLPSLKLTPVEVERHSSKFDLTLSFGKDKNFYRVAFEYNTELFDAPTIKRMADNYITLLESVIANPAQRIAHLPLLTADEERQVIHVWNATQTRFPIDQGVHEIIAYQAALTPNATAISCGGETLTYHALNQRANQLARYLLRVGVKPDQPVGLCVLRSLDMVVAMLGILKAGGAYVPLDPDYPIERLAFMTSDAGMAALVVHQQTSQMVASFTGARVTLDTDWDIIGQESTADLPAQKRPDQLAYIIYTSGSTGVPKGVQIPHRALVNFLAAMCMQPGMTAADVGLALTSISFDIAGLEIFLPLTLGCRVEIATREAAIDARQLAGVIDAAGVTLMQATPATWRALLETGWRGNPNLTLLTGGEAISRDLAQGLTTCGRSVWNMYGPTETTIWSTTQQLRQTDEDISIGRPIANTQAYLLDQRLEVVPIGVHGELYLGGSGLARGYRHRPDLTADRFIPDPFSSTPGARLYRTGDAARYRPNGTIEYLGRLDSQVKVRGFRIELGEIETVLAQHPAITQAVVIVREDIPGDQRIVAYVKVADTAPAAHDLRQHLQSRLPAYMIPAAFVTLADYPLTPNGKVDRRALPAPEGGPVAGETFVAPRTADEEALAAIWADILGIAQVSVEDNFFELGGHSLLATQMMSRIRDTFQIEIPLRTLFESPTIALLAAAIAEAKLHPQPAKASLVPITRSARRQQ